MVMVTRSAAKKSYDTSGKSDISLKNIIPPWCSSGKVHARRKLRKVASPTWEMRSSYPLRENIWEYLHEDKNENSHVSTRRTIKKFYKQSPQQNRRGNTFIYLMLLFIALGTLVWKSDMMANKKMIENSSTTKFISLYTLLQEIVDIKLVALNSPRSVDEECCHRMKHLAEALYRAEQALRRTHRLRWTMMLGSHTNKVDVPELIEGGYIEGVKVTKGDGTEEWGGQVALWGVVPLWRAVPPLHTVLTLRIPVPSDCWPLSGSSGEINIELPQKFRVHGLSIEHVRPDTARSAPKHFNLYAILENGTWVKAVDSEYRYQGPAKQYYTVIEKNLLQHLIFRVLSNQGNSKYTCVYRVHLYGGCENMYIT